MKICENNFEGTPCNNEAVINIIVLADPDYITHTSDRCIGCTVLKMVEEISTAYAIETVVLTE